MSVDWDLLIENHLDKGEKKMSLGLLMESINEVLAEVENQGSFLISEQQDGGRFSYSIKLPTLTPNETWGDPSSQSREQIDRVFSAITRKPSIKERIEHVNTFLNPETAIRKAPGGKVNTLLSMMQVIEALQSCLNDYNESSAGFVFEGFMAALTGGKQISGRVGGTLPIEDFVAFTETGDSQVPTSLKLLSPNTVIHGSFTNLIDYLFIRGGSGIEKIKYLIALKKEAQEGGQVEGLLLYEFTIGRNNLIDTLMNSGKKNKELLGAQADRLKKHINNWNDSQDWRLKMFKILKETPGYTKNKGMFYTSLTAAGDFEEREEKKKSDDKRHQFDLAQKQADKVYLLNLANKAGKEAFFGTGHQWADWIEDLEIIFPPETKASRKKGLSPKRDAYIQDLKDEFEAGYRQAAEENPTPQASEKEDDKLLRPVEGGTSIQPGGRIPMKTNPLEEGVFSYFGSFHEREKRLMKEELLNEAKGSSEGGSQWGLTRGDTLKSLRTLLGTEVYGTLDLSQDNITKLTEIYIEKLGEDLITLLDTTKLFTENIGLYFTAEDRSEAMEANKEAIDQGNQIVTKLSKDPAGASEIT